MLAERLKQNITLMPWSTVAAVCRPTELVE
jgi:hypothetical protein